MSENTNTEIIDDFTEEDVPASGWFKFKNVGDSVFGELVEYDKCRKSKRADYPDQRVFGLKQIDGSIIYVGIRTDKQYIINRTNNIDFDNHLYKVKFEYKKDVPAKEKGHAPAKSIEVYIKKTDKPQTPADEFNNFGN